MLSGFPCLYLYCGVARQPDSRYSPHAMIHSWLVHGYAQFNEKLNFLELDNSHESTGNEENT